MLTITPIPAFSDNYIWLLEHPGSNSAAVVDPGDAEPVVETLRRKGLSLTAVLVTHLHGDHCGGVRELAAEFPGLRVFGPARESIRGRTHALAEGDRVVLDDLHASFEVLDVPGHTSGHIAYYGHGILFCGDTLFACGCGRVFSGTLAQLHDSLKRIRDLPEETLVYCAHEYTLDNIGFARWVEPENPMLLEREAAEKARRKNGRPTVPSRLSTELATNPFLRTDQATVVEAAERYAGRTLSAEADVFSAVRTWKDKKYD